MNTRDSNVNLRTGDHAYLMHQAELSAFMGAAGPSSNEQWCGSSANAPFAALQPVNPTASPKFESALSYETSDEETAHHEHQSQDQIDPTLHLQYHDLPIAQPSVTSETSSTSPGAEVHQRPQAKISDAESNKDNCVAEDLLLSKHLIQEAASNHAPQTSQTSVHSFQLGVESGGKIFNEDGLTMEHDSIELDDQYINAGKKCVWGHCDDNLDKLLILVRGKVKTHFIVDTIRLRLSDDILAFYQEVAHPTNLSLQYPTYDVIWNVVGSILNNQKYDADRKIREIVEKVDKLYGGAGWVLTREQPTETITSDSGYYDTAAITPNSTPKPKPQKPSSVTNCQYSSPTPQPKHSITTGEAEPALIPPYKRQKTAPGPIRSPRALNYTTHSSPSPSVSNSKNKKCREPGCNCSPKHMKRHYLEIHCINKVYICPLANGRTSCLYHSPRRSNFRTHFLSKHDATTEEIEEADEKLKLDDYILSVPGLGHLICPLCNEEYSTCELCLDHMMTHYDDGTSVDLSFKDWRQGIHDKKSDQEMIRQLVAQKVEKRNSKPKVKPPSDQDGHDHGGDEYDEDDGDQGGSPHGGKSSGHQGHMSKSSRNGADYQRRPGGGTEHGPGPGQPNVRHREKRCCNAESKSSITKNSVVYSISGDKSNEGNRNFIKLPVLGTWDHGDTAPRLTYVGELGRGGFGVVDEVRCESTKQTYARKVVSSSTSTSLSISSEVSILRRLHHSHIIKLVDTWESPLKLCLLMSPVAKMDLAAYLRRVGAEPHSFSSFNAFAKQPLRRWIGCLSSALAYMHENGVVHGDIKPKNILISSDQVLYIADFGTAKCVDEFTKIPSRRFSAITPMYCAPEIVNKQMAALEYPADVFSLGCVWAEIATVYAGRSVEEFEKFRRFGSLNGAYHATIPRTILWIDSLSIPRELYDNCAHNFLTAVKDMLKFDPQKRPTMKNLTTRFPCPCPYPKSTPSDGQALLSAKNQSYGYTNGAITPHWFSVHQPDETPHDLRYNNVRDGKWLTSLSTPGKDYKRKERFRFESLPKDSLPNDRSFALSFFSIVNGCQFPVNSAFFASNGNRSKHSPSEKATIMCCLQQADNPTISLPKQFSYGGGNDLDSLKDYFPFNPRPSKHQEILEIWSGFVNLSIALMLFNQSLTKDNSRFQIWKWCTLSLISSGLARLAIQGREYGPPAKCDGCNISNTCENAEIATSLGCIYLQILDWIFNVTASPENRGEVCTQASDIASNLQNAIGYSQIVEKSISSGNFDHCAMVQHLYKLVSCSDPISKYVSANFISDLLPKVVSMRQIFSLVYVQLSRDLFIQWINALEHTLHGRDIQESNPFMSQLYRLARIFPFPVLQNYGEKLHGLGKPLGTQKQFYYIEKLIYDIGNQGAIKNLLQQFKLPRFRTSSPLEIHSPPWLGKHFVKEDTLFHEQENHDLRYVMDHETDNETDRNSTPRIFSSDKALDHCMLSILWLEKWLREDRDFKSFSVIEYDPFQSARRELHEQLLKNALNRHFSVL